MDANDFFYKKGDKTVGGRIALRKFERFESLLMKTLSRSTGIAVDVGANIGYYSLILADRFSKVIAYEPEPENFWLLKKNVKANEIKNIQMVQRAVSDGTALLQLGLSDSNPGDHQIESEENGRRVIKVKASTLDDDIKSKVSFLKIDTQGWEPKVILGAQKIISRDLPTIFMEFWPAGYKRSSLDYMQMIGYLESVYGKIYLIDDYLQLVYPVQAKTLEKRCLNKKGYVDLLFMRRPTWSDKWQFIKRFRVKNWVKSLLKI